jgi:2-polyprenyl-3-methyl-5-hydroxy-6-metoxy-1,4-benzoquinol methylase
MDRSGRFWDRMAQGYSERPVANEAAYREKLEITRKYLGADMQVLEFGCGTGSTAILHAPYVKQILAIDISSKMIEIAQAKAAAQSIDNVAFRQSSVAELRAQEQTFDVVLGLSVLHLLDDREEVIARVHAMLAPGGVFVSSTVCMGDRMKAVKFLAPLGRLFGLILKVFTATELQDGLLRAGFEIAHQWQPGDGSVFIIARKGR